MELMTASLIFFAGIVVGTVGCRAWNSMRRDRVRRAAIEWCIKTFDHNYAYQLAVAIEKYHDRPINTHTIQYNPNWPDLRFALEAQPVGSGLFPGCSSIKRVPFSIPKSFFESP